MANYITEDDIEVSLINILKSDEMGYNFIQYDSNGNVICEQDGSFEEEDVEYHRATEEAEGVYSTDYAWAYFKDDNKNGKGKHRYHRTYTWDEKNRLINSTDSSYNTSYVYGQDGQRSNKYTQSSETLYFNKMWTFHTDSGNSVYGGQTAKNIYLGETRIVTKLNSGTEPTYQEEYYKQYYYHSDHLGSASLISDYKGDEYQRIEYTPYGETWVEKTENTGLEFLPYKFTAKELDEETGLYYYGARYLDHKYSRWISTDPALGDYIPQAPINDEAKKNNQNLPGMGGIFNPINSDLYHYAGNNPVRYTDPTGMMNEELETPNKVNDMASAVVATGEAALKEAGRPQFTNSKSTAFNDLGVTEGVQISAPMKIIDQKAESAASSAKTLSRAGKLFGVIGIVIATADVVIVGVKSKDANTTIKRAIRNTSVIIGSMISSKGASAIGTAVAGPVGGAVTGIAAGTAVGVYIDSKFEEVGW